jgi:hypothetical protein
MSRRQPSGHLKDDSLWKQLCLRCCESLRLTVYLAKVVF